ncbi:hypothetical protein [Streptomyces sp. NPDC017448]|uniref:hypothetical protein n=1 Tax=Streptomyces sp. NPDC017448 TaxID=3364996 RepID=UPI0037BC3314
MKLNPDALASCGDVELDERDGVQEVDHVMIREWVLSENELPPESARPFAEWLHFEWNSFNEDGDCTVRQVIEGGLVHWRGGK